VVVVVVVVSLGGAKTSGSVGTISYSGRVETENGGKPVVVVVPGCMVTVGVPMVISSTAGPAIVVVVGAKVAGGV
jgi:hypothetical protein